MKIAVFCPNLIGDTVMATPTFRACAQGFPDATIIGVIKPRWRPTLDAIPWFDDWIYFDRHSSHRLERTAAVVRRLRRERFELAVLLPNTFRSCLVGVDGRIPRTGRLRPLAAGMLLTNPAVGSPRYVEAADTDADRRVLSQARSAARLPGQIRSETRAGHDGR